MENGTETTTQETAPQADEQGYGTVDEAVDALANKLAAADNQETPQDADAAPLEDEQQEATPEEFIEVTLGDQTYQLPKAFNDQFVPKAEATKKFMEAAEVRKQSESVMQYAQSLGTGYQHLAKIEAQQMVLGGQIQQIEQALPALYQQDKAEYSAAAIQAQNLRMQYGQLDQQKGSLGQAVQQITDEQLVRGYTAMNEALSKNAWWNDTARSEVADFLLKNGFSERELRSVIDPKAVTIAYEAMMYRKGKTAVADSKNARVIPKVVKPGTQQNRNGLMVAQERFKKTGSIEDAIQLEMLKHGGR